jgi:hypothetical protein
MIIVNGHLVEVDPWQTLAENKAACEQEDNGQEVPKHTRRFGEGAKVRWRFGFFM